MRTSNRSAFRNVTVAVIVMTAIAWPAAAAMAGPIAADPGEGVPRLSLREAVLMSLDRNPDLAAVRAEADAAGAGAREARAARLPRLVGEAGWHSSDDPVVAFGDKLTASEFTAGDFALDRLNDPDPIRHGTAALQLEVPIDLSGRLSAGIDAARGAAQAGAARAGGARADLIAAVTEAYFGVALARAAVDVAASALANAEAHEAVAAARLEAGSALRSDRLRAKVERLARLRDRERRRADLEIARARLGRLLGLPPGEIVEPSAGLSAPQEPAGGLDDWIDGAADARPEVREARRGAESAEAALRTARAELRPETFGSLRYQRDANEVASGAGSYLVGVTVRWSAFDAGRGARIEAARARAAAAAARERSALAGMRLEIETAYRDLIVAGSNLAAAREGNAAAAEARRITADRYAAGLVPLTDLLDTETAVVAAQLAELSALYDTVVGRARLERAAGRMEVPR